MFVLMRQLHVSLPSASHLTASTKTTHSASGSSPGLREREGEEREEEREFGFISEHKCLHISLQEDSNNTTTGHAKLQQLLGYMFRQTILRYLANQSNIKLCNLSYTETSVRLI